jgi:lysophospholipase L1-like esterase
MKSTFTLRNVCLLPVLFLLTLGWNAPVLAQDSHAPVVAADVSQFPTNAAMLPGKGPSQVWSGLARAWAQRHAEWAKTAGQDDGAVVFLGDSIIQGWKSLPQDFPNLKVANRGIGGDTTRGVLYRLNADVLALKPKAVVLLIGTNDLGNGADPADVADNIEAILTAIKNYNPNVPVIVCKVLPRGTPESHYAEKIEKLNALVENFVQTRSNFYECDTWSIFADENGYSTKDIFPDLLHPNATGYARWTAALKPVLSKLNLEATKS